MYLVYQSTTGFSREYAQMLGQAQKMKVCSLDEAQEQLPRKAEIFFFGGLLAGHINGIDQAVKRYTVKGVCGVGMSPPSPSVLTALSRSNYVPNAPIFYLQGGWRPSQVSWLKQRMVHMATRSQRRQLQAKHPRSAEEEKQLSMLLHGGSFVAFHHLKPIQTWLASQTS